MCTIHHFTVQYDNGNWTEWECILLAAKPELFSGDWNLQEWKMTD